LGGKERFLHSLADKFKNSPNYVSISVAEESQTT
jgi:hypothetical protein